MLRMAHRIAAHGIKTVEAAHYQDIARNITNRILSGATVLIADNCAQTIFDSELQCDNWIDPYALPCIKPPFSEMLIEYEVPESYNTLAMAEHGANNDLRKHLNNTSTHGAFVTTVSHEMLARIVTGAASRPDIRAMPQYKSFKEMYDLGGESVVTISVLAVYQGIVTLSPVLFLMAIDESGALINGSLSGCSNDLTVEQSSAILSHAVGPIFFALAMCHCKNVEQVDATVEYSPSAKWTRRQKTPEIKYKVLQIEAAKKTLKTHGNSDGNGYAKALHICRGHFATYTEDKPLFGHTVGTVWRPSHVRGDIKAGAVVKDYSIKNREDQ